MCLFLILPLTSYYLLPATIYSLLASQSASQPARRSRQQRVTKLALLFHLTGIILIMIIIIFIWPTIRHLSYQATVASRHFALVPIVSRPLAVAAHWASPSCSPFVTWPRLSRAQLVVYILHYILLQISPKKNCTHSSLLARIKTLDAPRIFLPIRAKLEPLGRAKFASKAMLSQQLESTPPVECDSPPRCRPRSNALEECPNGLAGSEPFSEPFAGPCSSLAHFFLLFYITTRGHQWWLPAPMQWEANRNIWPFPSGALGGQKMFQISGLSSSG